MQDWPIEVSDPGRLPDFLGLLETHRDDVLESARERPDLDRWSPRIHDGILVAVEATGAPALIARLGYWACTDSPLEDAFEVSPLVREVLRELPTLRSGPIPTM